jgi:hypothetical protein
MTYAHRRKTLHRDSSDAPLNPEDVEVVVNEEEAAPKPREFVKRRNTADLGWCFARYDSDTEMLTIVSPGDYSSSPAVPPAIVQIAGKPNLHSLMHFVRNSLYPASAK